MRRSPHTSSFRLYNWFFAGPWYQPESGRAESMDALVTIFERALTARTKLILLSHLVNLTEQFFPVKQGVASDALQRHLQQRHSIVVQSVTSRWAPEIHGIRITPNRYTRLEELDRFCGLIEDIAAKGLPS